MNAQLCLACGEELSDALGRAGSLRCQDCRDANAPLDPALCAPVEQAEHRNAA